MKAFKITALALASSLLLAGCGGSGDSTTNNTENTGGISPLIPLGLTRFRVRILYCSLF